MKLKTLIGCFAVALFFVGCATPTTTNTTTNTATTTTTYKTATTNTATTTTNTTNTTNTSSTNAPDSSTAQGKQDFTLHNETGVEIDKLYVSPSDKDDWEEDILGRDTLPSGESIEITFHPKEKAAMWDIKVVDKEGTSIMWENLNLMEISDVTLYFKNGKGTAEVK